MTPSTVLAVRTSPHAHAPRSVEKIMANVVFALLPICIYAVWLFGISALALMIVTTAAALGTEVLFCRASRKRSSIGDFSAVITGLLLGLTLPPALPLWMGALGAFIAIGPGKMVFGGLGFNVFNRNTSARCRTLHQLQVDSQLARQTSRCRTSRCRRSIRASGAHGRRSC